MWPKQPHSPIRLSMTTCSYPPLGLVTWNPAWTRNHTICLCICHWHLLQHHKLYENIIYESQTSLQRWNYNNMTAVIAIRIFEWLTFLIWFNSLFLTQSNSISPLRFDSHPSVLFLFEICNLIHCRVIHSRGPTLNGMSSEIQNSE